MKKILIIVAFVLVLIGIAFGTAYLFRPHAPAPAGTGTTFPSGGTVPSSGGEATPPVEIPTANGTQIEAKDFIHNGTTVEDPANKGNYYLAGSSGACNPDGTCPAAGNDPDFQIVYWSGEGSFTIALTSEPLGAARIKAERYLMTALGLTQQQMCALKYSLTTTAGVNETYAGKNLGFSFCPGAVALPS